MKCDKHTMLLYAVTDRAWVGEQTLYQQVESALKGGATCVQLREKQLGDADFLQEAIQIHALCQQYGVPLFINDNVEVALQCHAEGIHVGQDDMSAAQVRQRVGDGVMIGVSAHTVQEALDAVAHGADYLGVGAVFATHTKTDVSEMPRQTRSRDRGRGLWADLRRRMSWVCLRMPVWRRETPSRDGPRRPSPR